MPTGSKFPSATPACSQRANVGPMPIGSPSLREVVEVADDLRLGLTSGALASYLPRVSAILQSYEYLQDIASPEVGPPETRDAGRRPLEVENPLGAWSWRCNIGRSRPGPLEGKRLTVKDNIAVAGMPMLTAAPVPPGFVPAVDATVVQRCLDAGAEIVGKAALSRPTPLAETVRNPHDLSRFAGGSSGGSAALVATGECDLSIGTDQGGSIRIPSAWCGVCGLKPTFGLVPYTGIIPREWTLDHVGPIASTVMDLAALLDVIAGADNIDSRQIGLRVSSYSDSTDLGVNGMRVGLLAEGFGIPGSDSRIDALVHLSAQTFSKLGARLLEVSLPSHHDGVHLFQAIHREGMLSLLQRDGGLAGWNGTDPLWTAMVDEFPPERSPAASLPEVLKVQAIAAALVRREHGSHYYVKARALGRQLSARYDALFDSVDVLVMPTLPQLPPLLEAAGTQLSGGVESVFRNMSAFNVTGHPALTLPCGRVDGLPVGIQIVGPRWGDDTVLRAGYALESAQHESA
jgi:amidase